VDEPVAEAFPDAWLDQLLYSANASPQKTWLTCPLPADAGGRLVAHECLNFAEQRTFLHGTGRELQR
jgi:hypothetical protein